VSQKYYEAFKDAMNEPAAKEALAGQGIVPVLLPPQQVPAFMQAELEKHTALAKRAGLTAQ
jgi:tripartite-type tricarboxylate transporter receptor subunit TctC